MLSGAKLYPISYIHKMKSLISYTLENLETLGFCHQSFLPYTRGYHACKASENPCCSPPNSYDSNEVNP
jgi:hypothetical protein